ncbi:MAG TPA: hypothetical protein DCY88_27625 [Cyanobacteria bacterium UBA11372]|nr:hypothetical protein [Cyanobacteria bacterium UBA11372]
MLAIASQRSDCLAKIIDLQIDDVNAESGKTQWGQGTLDTVDFFQLFELPCAYASMKRRSSAYYERNDAIAFSPRSHAPYYFKPISY